MILRPPVFDGTLLAGGGALIALGRGTASASVESVSPPGNLSPRNLKANKRKQHQQHCQISLSCVKGSPVPLMELLRVKVSGAPDTVAGLGAAGVAGAGPRRTRVRGAGLAAALCFGGGGSFEAPGAMLRTRRGTVTKALHLRVVAAAVEKCW